MTYTGNKNYVFAKDNQKRGQKTQETADWKEAKDLHRQGGVRGHSKHAYVPFTL